MLMLGSHEEKENCQANLRTFSASTNSVCALRCCKCSHFTSNHTTVTINIYLPDLCVYKHNFPPKNIKLLCVEYTDRKHTHTPFRLDVKRNKLFFSSFYFFCLHKHLTTTHNGMTAHFIKYTKHTLLFFVVFARIVLFDKLYETTRRAKFTLSCTHNLFKSVQRRERGSSWIQSSTFPYFFFNMKIYCTQ